MILPVLNPGIDPAVSLSRTDRQGWGVCSAGKGLVMQVQKPGFASPEPMYKTGHRGGGGDGLIPGTY